MNELENALKYFSLSGNPASVLLNLSKNKSGIEYSACFDPETNFIIVYESSSNPHQTNSEIKCDWKEYLNQSTEDAYRIKSIIISNFGEKNYYHLIFSIIQMLQNKTC